MELEKIIVKYGADISELKKQLEDVKKSTTGIETEAKSLGNTVSTKLNSAFSTLGATIAAAFAVERIGSFISSSIELAVQAQEIKAAFDKLNNPLLLSNLRKATEGTLSDLKLMGVALRADKLQVPIDKLAKILQFAKLRADELGKSTEELADSLIQGIGIKGTRALVQVGISQEQFGAEIKKTGDYFTALDNIMTETLDKAGEGFESAADKQDKLRASIENTKVEIGNGLLPVLDKVLDATNKWVKGMSLIPDYFKLLFDFDGDFQRLIQNNKQAKEEFEKYTEAVKAYTTDDDIIAFTRSYTDRLANQAEQIRQNTQFASASAKIMGEEQVAAINKLIGFIENYSKTLIKKDTVDNENIETTKKQKDATEDLNKELLKLIDNNKKILKQNSTDAWDYYLKLNALITLMAKDNVKQYDDMGEEITTTTDEIGGYIFNMWMAQKEGIKEWYESWQYYGGQVTALWDGMSSFFRSQEEGKLALLQSRLDQGLISEKQYNDQVKDVQREQAKRDKLLAVFNVLADTPAAIVQGLSQGGPAGAVLAAAIAAVQLGTALALDIPQFKTGVIDFKGKGTETSDSNLVMISKGESVINAKSTKKHRDILEAINKDRFEQYMANKYKGDVAIGWDDYRLLLELKKGTQASRENTKQIVKAIEKRPHRF